MMYRFFVLLTLISQVACGQPTLRKQSQPFAFVDSLLKKDEITVEILDFTFPPDVQAIMSRFQKAMTENHEWALDYVSKYFKEGEGLPYNEKFGISREEYQKIKDIEKYPPSVVVKYSASVKINRTSNGITFTTADKETRFLELLKIDLSKETVLFNNDTVPFHSEFNAPASTPFGEWHCYAWKKETSNLGDNDDIKLDKLVSKIIEIDFGRVKSNDKNILRIKYKDLAKGQVNANLDIACYIK